MLENQTTLITILKEVIESNQEKIENLENITTSSVIIYKKELKKLKEDINYLINLNLDIVERVLDEAEIDPKEQDNIYEYFKVIKELLVLNKKENTTFKFYNNQLSKVNRFFDYVEILQNKNKVYHESNINELEELKIKNGKYLDLLDQITNKNDKSYISDINIVKSLLNECKINSNIKREIFYNLMRYNALCNS